MPAPTLNLLPIRVCDVEHKDMRELAREIQKDLRRLSQEDIVASSLKKIYEWTEVRIDCFINILRDTKGEVGSEGSEVGKNEEDIVFEEDGSDLRRERAEIMEAEHCENPAEDLRKDLHEAYLPSVDVEMRLCEDGGLDVGVFAPVECMEVEMAKKMIGELGDVLRKIT